MAKSLGRQITDICRKQDTVTKVAYVAGPYRSKYGWIGQALNIYRARKLAQILWLRGYTVICPHMNSAFMRGEDEIFLEGDLQLLEMCDVVFFLPGWQRSMGARNEMRHAGRCGKEIITLDRIEDAKNFKAA